MERPPGSELQLFYARFLDRAAKLAFLLLLLTFAVYVAGVLNPHVPLEELPRYWGQPARVYLKATQSPTGWAWLGKLHHGDILNFLPLALLAGVSFLGYLGLLVKFFLNREKILGLIVLLQLLVLGLAVSGVFRVGGH